MKTRLVVAGVRVAGQRGALRDNTTEMFIAMGWFYIVIGVVFTRVGPVHTHCTSVRFLVLMYCSHIRWNHWRELGEVYTGPLCIIFIISWDYNYYKTKS